LLSVGILKYLAWLEYKWEDSKIGARVAGVDCLDDDTTNIVLQIALKIKRSGTLC
jgi:hypothetical protein